MDDLITRLRTLMAEVEARIREGEVLHDEDVSPKLRDALSGLPGAYPAKDETPKDKPPQDLRASDLCLAKVKDRKPSDSYVARDPLHDEGFDPADFIGTGDRDPLGHDEAIRR